MSDKQKEKKNANGRSETYIHDYNGVSTTQYMAKRTAERDAGFFLPYLRSGMTLLDCGCGLGSITVGLAKAVSPGQVLGLDMEDGQLKIATFRAIEMNLSNIRFVAGNVYQLPFDDNSFDAIFANALLEHLSEPVGALEEMFRVLKNGGIIGIRSGNLSPYLIEPSNSVLESAFDLYYRFRQHNGGDPFAGRKLRGLLRKAGFVDTKASASYNTWGTVKETRSFFDVLIAELAGPLISKQSIKLGWADENFFNRVKAAAKEWSEHPDALFAISFCEAVGSKS